MQAPTNSTSATLQEDDRVRGREGGHCQHGRPWYVAFPPMTSAKTRKHATSTDVHGLTFHFCVQAHWRTGWASRPSPSCPTSPTTPSAPWRTPDLHEDRRPQMSVAQDHNKDQLTKKQQSWPSMLLQSFSCAPLSYPSHDRLQLLGVHKLDGLRLSLMRSVWHWCVPQVDELWCAWAHLLEARFAQQGGVKHVFQSPLVQAVLGGVHFVGHRLLWWPTPPCVS